MSRIDFENIAIKCDTWEQMQHVAEVAKEQGLRIVNLSDKYFSKGHNLFRRNVYGKHYANYMGDFDLKTIHYTELFTETPVINPVAWADDVHVMD